jgi:hypothetical protein
VEPENIGLERDLNGKKVEKQVPKSHNLLKQGD